MGRNRKKAGGIGAVTYDIFGNVIEETPAAPATTGPSDAVTKALSDKAWRVMDQSNPEYLLYVMDEAAREGITELPITAPDGRTFIMRRVPGQGSTIQLELSPEDENLYQRFRDRHDRYMRQTLTANDNVYYRTAYHPATYYLAQAQNDYINNPMSREAKDRLDKMQQQYDAVRRQLSPKVVELFDEQYSQSGALPLPRSVMLAQAAQPKAGTLTLFGPPDPFAAELLNTPARFNQALRALRLYDKQAQEKKSAVDRADRSAATLTPTQEVIKSELQYEVQRLLGAAKRLQANMDKAIMRKPKLENSITAEDKQQRKIREQTPTMVGVIDVG